MKKIEKSIHILVNVGLILTLGLGLVFPLVYTAFIKTQFNSGLETKLGKDLILNIGYGSFYILYLPYLSLIFKLRKISQALSRQDYFNRDIPKNLNIMASLIFILGGIYLGINLFLYFRYGIYLYALTLFPSILVVFISLTLGMIFIFAANLYKSIINIKEENDLTI